MKTPEKEAWLRKHGDLDYHPMKASNYTAAWSSHSGIGFLTSNDSPVNYLYAKIKVALWLRCDERSR